MKNIFVLVCLVSLATICFGQRTLSQPPAGQRCSGRNINGRRCCTPENPCERGEGDCDGPLDGGANDGHAGCRGDLVCGSNNCKQFGSYFHEKDDCCDVASSIAERPPPVLVPGAPLEPPAGQQCRGRNYEGRRCCTPENPCGEGEGDCDGAGDGGQNDGNRGCRGNLVCGSNNCLKFGAYYHEKDDCCEQPLFSDQPIRNELTGDWGPWSKWTGCGKDGRRTRIQRCNGNVCTLGNGRLGTENLQERYCKKKK